MSEVLSVSELDSALDELVQWERFAYHLPGITPKDVKTIQKNKRDDNEEQKLALYEVWLDKYPRGTWEDIIHSLEKAKHNRLAEELKKKYKMTKTPSREGAAEEIQVQKHVVNDLDKLQKSFVPLVTDVQEGINEAVKCDKMFLSRLVNRTEEERAFTIPELKTVQTTNSYFNAIRPHYTFLNCYLLVCVAQMLLDPIRAAANEYERKVNKLKNKTAVKRFKDTLQYYCPAPIGKSDTMVQVTIVLEDKWGREKIWLVEELVKKLFDLRNPDECQWFRVVPGSVMVVFLAPKHMMMNMIVSASKRRGLMTLLGVNAILVGECLMLVRTGEIDFLTSLLYDVQNKYDTTQLLLKNANVDIDQVFHAKNLDQKRLPSQHFETLQQATKDRFDSMTRAFPYQLSLITPELENEISSGRLTLESLVSCINESIVCPIEGLANVRSVHELFQVIQPYYTFLNNHIIQQLALQLSGIVGSEAYEYLQESQTKSTIMVSELIKLLQKHLDASSVSPIMMKVTLTLDDTWQAAKMNVVEQLIQFLFNLKHPDELLWHRVRYGSVIIEFLAPKNMMMHLITNSVKQKQLMTLMGVMRLQIGNIVVHKTTQQLTLAESRDESKNLQSKKAQAIYGAYDTQRRSTASLIEFKVDKNRNLTYVNHSTFTCLMIACMHGEARLAKLLLGCGADPNYRNAHGYTSFLYASEIGNTKIMELLLQYGADIDTQKENGDTALVCATRMGNAHTVNFLIKRKADLKAPDGSTVLHIAAQMGHTEIVVKLLKEGMDPNHRDKNNKTCLHTAILHSNVLEILLKMKVDVNAQDSLGNTPLAYASTIGNWMAVDQLLNAGANPEIATYNTLQVPLHTASHLGHHRVVKRLLEANANVNIQDVHLCTPLGYAAFKGHKEVVKILLKAKADPNIQGMTDQCVLVNVSETGNADMVELLLEGGADLFGTLHEGSTSLHAACRTGHLKVVDLLLKKGLNPNTPQDIGMNSLHAACRYGQPHIVERLLKEKMNLEAKTNNGLTALQLAVLHGHKSIVPKLLQAGADSSIPDAFTRK